MSALTFNLKTTLKFTLDVSPITPTNLEKKTISQIKKIKLDYGKQTLTVNDFFTVSGKNSNDIVIKGSSEKLTHIGHGMSFGTIKVCGDIGNFVGQHMQGGHIKVEGNAGDWVGNSMENGQIEIDGDVGDYLGAGLPGAPYGMSDGLILISGNAGDRVGDRLRRGYIIICGKAGDYCGSRMVAGTIIVLNKAGKYPGFGMKRGTIIMAKKPKHIAATFKSCGNLKIQFLRLLFKQLSEIGQQFSFFEKYGPEAHRFAGDLASNGKGEILILQTINNT